MVKLITIKDLQTIIRSVGLKPFFQKLTARLEKDFTNWEKFHRTPRHAIHLPHGVMELMPTCSDKYYSYKFVNGHPENPKASKLTVVAVGALAEIQHGYPLMISEMTLLTGLRTAATAAMASKYLANPNPKTVAIIGCGVQSEFQVMAHAALFDIQKVQCYDINPDAMQRFAKNFKDESFEVVLAKDGKSCVQGADIVITATAVKKHAVVLEHAWLQPGQHINGIGGDCPGKTELDIKTLKASKIFVEYLPQTKVEGDIQLLGDAAESAVSAELWQVITKQKAGRQAKDELTLFDSVGFAVEDYSVLRLVYALAEELHVGESLDLVPSPEQSKNLFELVR